MHSLSHKGKKKLPINHPGGAGAGVFDIQPQSLVGAWLSLRNNNYTTVSALCEFIDNILNHNSNKKAIISIDWYISRKHPSQNILKIKDNAEGIPRDILKVVFTLGRGKVINSIKIFSEHGFGMKAAMVSLGDIKGFKTKYCEEKFGSELVENNITKDNADKIPNLRFEEFEDDDWVGTEITLNRLEHAYIPDSSREMKNISTQLGAIYAKFIDDGKLEIKLAFHNKDTMKEEHNANVESHHKIWAHGTKRDVNGAPVQEPDLPMTIIKGGKGKNAWEARVKMGYKPTDEQLFDMTGQTKWPETSPYSPIHKNIGFDVIKDGRVIIHRVTSPISQIVASGRGNVIQGEIHLVKGFTTTTTKDSMRGDRNWKELVCKLQKLIKDQRLDDRVKSGFKKVRGTEQQLTNKIVRVLQKDTGFQIAMGIRDADKEIVAFQELYNSDGEPIGEADILISPTDENNRGSLIYEIKKEEAGVDAVRQIFGYMKARGIKNGIVGAQEITTKAKNLIKEYNNNHNVNIKFWDYTELSSFN